MKGGGTGTAILLILFLLIIVALLFPNRVEQFLSQFNISFGNGTVNLGQVFQQFTNGLQNFVNNGNSYQNYSEFGIFVPIFNAEDTFNVGVSSELTYVGPILYNKSTSSLQPPVIVPTDDNITVYENGNNINFSFGLEYSGGCNNTINSIYIQDPQLVIGISSFNPSNLSSYHNYSGNSNFITFGDLILLYIAIALAAHTNMTSYNVTIQNNQYGFSCEPTGVVQLNPTVTVSCSININQLESDPQIQSIMNEINSAGNSSLWLGLVSINVSYNCQ
jgi:hypothetical protein